MSPDRERRPYTTSAIVDSSQTPVKREVASYPTREELELSSDAEDALLNEMESKRKGAFRTRYSGKDVIVGGEMQLGESHIVDSSILPSQEGTLNVFRGRNTGPDRVITNTHSRLARIRNI